MKKALNELSLESTFHGTEITTRTCDGVNFGAGLEIESFQLTVQYGIRIPNLFSDSKIEHEIRNSVIGFSVVCFFAEK